MLTSSRGLLGCSRAPAQDDGALPPFLVLSAAWDLGLESDAQVSGWVAADVSVPLQPIDTTGPVGLRRRPIPSAYSVDMLRRPIPSAYSVGALRRPAPSAACRRLRASWAAGPLWDRLQRFVALLRLCGAHVQYAEVAGANHASVCWSARTAELASAFVADLAQA